MIGIRKNRKNPRNKKTKYDRNECANETMSMEINCKNLLESFISGTDKHSWLITVFGIPFGKFVTVRFQFLVTLRLRWIGRVSGPECGILVLIHTPFHSTLKPPDQVVEIPTSCSESCIVNDEKTC